MMNSKPVKELFNIEIVLEKEEIIASHDNIIKGIIAISIKEQLQLNGIVVQLVQEKRGKIETAQTVIERQKLFDKAAELELNKDYQIPFEFDISPSMETYKGKNFSVLYKVEVLLLSGDQLESGGVTKKLKSVFQKKERVRYEKYVKIQHDRPYKIIPPTDTSLNVRSNHMVTALMTGILLLAFYFIARPEEFHISFVIVGAFVFFLSKGIQKELIPAFISRMAARFENIDNDKFKVLIQLGQLKKYTRTANVYYKVMEKTIDRRGTGDSIFLEEIYTSGKENFSTINDGYIQAILSYPERKGLATKKMEDETLYWVLILEVKTILGIDYNFEKVYDVRHFN